MKKEKFYVTTPIYYVNADPHIGHMYTTVAADVLARYHRLLGESVFFSTGTDEHGAKIAQKAEASGEEPQAFVDRFAERFKDAWNELGISYTAFIRTTDPQHEKAVQKALQYMYEKGDIYLDKYEGLYCVGCEQFKNEKDLVDGKCPDHQTAPEQTTEENYVFKMSKYGERIQAMIEKDEILIRPIERKNEMLGFFKEGLRDVSFSRKHVKWGVPIPWDESHTTYVWVDAFFNYLTVLGWPGSGGVLPTTDDGTSFWPADVHIMSKDIIRVHASIWPAMLMSLDLPTPKQLFVHGYFLSDGQKMSKSLGNVISPMDIKERYGVDAARYLLMAATPFGRDGDIGWEKFDDKFTADLANGIGNLTARTIAMTLKLRDNGGELIACDSIIDIPGIIKKYQENISELHLDAALDNVWTGLIHELDQYISKEEPFRLIGKDNVKAGEILYRCLETLRIIALLIYPYMPETAEKISERLGLFFIAELGKDFGENTIWGQLETSTSLEKGEALFPRLS
jgi:methionyl-tRNA synthetase